MLHVEVDRLETWLVAVGRLLNEQIAPRDVRWEQPKRVRTFLGIARAEDRANAVNRREAEAPLFASVHNPLRRLPKRFLRWAELVTCHRDPARWDLLYRVLWQLTHGQPDLLTSPTDVNVLQLKKMKNAVRRDARKMLSTTFHRLGQPGEEYCVAWCSPRHRILKLVASELVKRFGVTRWGVLTPAESVRWDGHVLQFAAGVSLIDAPSEHELERLWIDSVAASFDPVHVDLTAASSRRVRRAAPRREQPLFAELGVAVPGRPLTLIDPQAEGKVSARQFLPARRTPKALRDAARCCKGCHLYEHATQTVFGEGPADARLMLIGEQPGDEEDVSGRPFVGPAGQLLDEALAQVGIDRRQIYVTNAVKHFKWTAQGSRRLHAKPAARELTACRPWLEAEIEAIRPRMIVCLGATAAQVIFGPEFRVSRQHGQVFSTPWAPWTMATYHPSALLRVPDETVRAQMQEQFLYDLRRTAQQLESLHLSPA